MYLFHDTVRANLLYARPLATDSDIERACRVANIWDFIQSLPEGKIDRLRHFVLFSNKELAFQWIFCNDR